MFASILDKLKGRRRDDSLRQSFATVYDSNVWASAESRSGLGSDRNSESVAKARDAIMRAVAEHGVRSMSDIPCGDCNWIPEVLGRLGSAVRYTGYDIVDALVEHNKKWYPHLSFGIMDITRTVPPKADLIFCKDLFNHLRYQDIKNAIENMKKSRSTFLLASNNPGCENTELPESGPGSSRYLDITGAPFTYAKPKWTSGNGYMGFWRLDEIGESGF